MTVVQVSEPLDGSGSSRRSPSTERSRSPLLVPSSRPSSQASVMSQVSTIAVKDGIAGRKFKSSLLSPYSSHENQDFSHSSRVQDRDDAASTSSTASSSMHAPIPRSLPPEFLKP
ncbi:hypothetical protein CANCADRAFT_44304 [Tortispora caseinolytica NRRL Y-17796]|uniref:Uncharacterized protein n=1 Tax=Tortispora caseinolytica NRRL Y-17796 TaxID=767744 RepID=A0A1E4TG14_9ASCO|nr:hypothetical protein CANCADRAFT_44304 [Tortispora caseinolytica NRRL Y-17796]